MRSLLLVACLVSLSGCYDPGAQDVGQAKLPASSSGRIEPDARCLGGQLFFELDRARGDELAATVFYESDAFEGERYRAIYRVEGVQRESGVVLDEVEMVESDALPPDRMWCTGSYSLKLDAQGVLSGSYQSDDCGCSGATTLSEAGF